MYCSTDQNLPVSAENSEWNMNTALPMRSLQSNTLEDTDGYCHCFESTALWSGGNLDPMGTVDDPNYNQGVNGLNFDPFIAASAMNPAALARLDDYDPGSMTSMNPNVAGGANNPSATSQALPLLCIDDNGGPSSFDQVEPTTQLAPSTSPGNTAWTKQEDKFLMAAKAQGLSYSDIQVEMRKEFGWARNKNVMGKHFAVLKKRYKPQIKTRIVRDISKRIMPEIMKAVGKELQKATSSDSNNVAAELEDLVHRKFPDFLENLVSDVCVSLNHPADDDDHDLIA